MNLKFCVVVLLFVYSISACKSQDDFKFKGPFPSDTFTVYKEAVYGIQQFDGDSVALRNRVYLFMDSTGFIYLNGHQTSQAQLKKDLLYVLTNPDRLDHLPNNFEDAVLFMYETNDENFKDGYQSQVQAVSTAIKDIYSQRKQHYIDTVYKNDLRELSPDEHLLLKELFSPTIALTNIQKDKGILMKLPPWKASNQQNTPPFKERNILNILVNEKGEAIINNEVIATTELTSIVKQFIMNPKQNPNFAERPNSAIISLKNMRSSPYKDYLAIYNAIRKAYAELWEGEAQAQFQQAFDNLERDQQKQIRQKIPMVISEAEPTGFD